ncbi:CHAT domain-containing protein [Sphingomonas parva]|uniref:CHAT domain-containing protein n=1 Tax=Sphingomonas parva TaxID=2555898 RepID=A0A4Y8ZYK0_9SPHN|nr:CHAT domain-containing protein [Sphingomonas parva]TFI60049.1 CHAT domain-containing protein [Sphingomonas parva]
MLAAALAAAPAAAATADDLCGSAPTPTAFPSDDALIAAAAQAETLLATGDAGALDQALRVLEIEAAGPGRPGARALAVYCSAAGEVMRRSPLGSQAQAHSFLTTAFRSATDEPRVSALSAYRLALVAVSAPSAGTTRGSSDETPAPAADAGLTTTYLAAAARTEIDSCGDLSDRNLARTTNAYLTVIALQCASARALRNGDAELAGLAGLRLARYWMALSRSPAEDRETMRREGAAAALGAVPAAAAIAAPGLRGEVVGRLLDTAIELGATDGPALADGLAAMRSNGNTDPGVLALAAEIEAKLALTGGEPARAVALAEQALLLESRRAIPTRLPGLYLLLAAADPAHRERHSAAAYAALENLRPSLPRLDPITEESTFALYMRDVFEQAADVALAAAQGDGGEARVSAAQIIIEASRQAELQNAVGSECLPPRDALKPQDLAAGEVVLYPLLLPDRIELLYLSGDEGGQRAFHRLPPDRSANRDEIARLVQATVLSTTYGDDEAWRVPAQRLYQLLIAPIEGRLKPGAMLAIIPDGPLRALPFAALLDGQGRFLIERTRVVVAPALAYLQAGTARGEDPAHVVAASLQRRVRLPAGSFPALKSTAVEAEIAAASGAPGRHIANFHRADLVREMGAGDVDVLHLATHASFNGRSDRAFIVADGEVIRLTELRDIIAANRNRGESLDLLVLSACETAVGDDETSMGLAGAAVQAGATSAIASLWQVDDAGTGKLMRSFYSAYGGGASRSAALRDAQLAMIRSGGADARPHIWAAFTLLGAWR